jgi:hypothetical protein
MQSEKYLNIELHFVLLVVVGLISFPNSISLIHIFELHKLHFIISSDRHSYVCVLYCCICEKNGP